MLWIVLCLLGLCGVLAKVSMPPFPPSLEITYFTEAHQIPEVAVCKFRDHLVPRLPSKKTQL